MSLSNGRWTFYEVVIFIVSVLLCLGAYAQKSAALTADEVLVLKKNGISDSTIQLMIQSEMEEKKRAESSIRITDDKSAITYSTGKPSDTPLSREERKNVDQAWEMLKNLSIEIEK